MITIQGTPTTLVPTQATQVGSLQRVRGGMRFDWAFTLACCWLIGGLHLDGWAHNHIPALETFFTPWHAVLYSGYGAIAAVLAVTLDQQQRTAHAGFPHEITADGSAHVDLVADDEHVVQVRRNLSTRYEFVSGTQARCNILPA